MKYMYYTEHEYMKHEYMKHEYIKGLMTFHVFYPNPYLGSSICIPVKKQRQSQLPWSRFIPDESKVQSVQILQSGSPRADVSCPSVFKEATAFPFPNTWEKLQFWEYCLEIPTCP